MIRKRVAFCILSGCLTALVLVGCKKPHKNNVNESDYDDVAAAVSALVVSDQGDQGAMVSASALAQGEATGFSASTSGSYEGSIGSLDYSYMLTCSDKNDATLQVCDSSTRHAELSVEWSGSYSLARYEGMISRSGSWSLDIDGVQAIFAGSGMFDVETTFTSLDGRRMRSFVLDYDADYSNVTLDLLQEKITAGSVVLEVHATRTRVGYYTEAEAEIDVEITIVFAADGTAELVMDGDRTYQLLADGQVIRQN